ncbi:MAG: LamG-like jellyroll fold domain-containing protein [Verrucomicrobiota bacterium]
MITVGRPGLQEAVVASNCDPPPSGIVAWWPGEGNATDTIGTNNAVLDGGVTYAPGEVGQAFSFAGTSGYVFVPASSELNVGLGGGLTVEGWIETPTTNVSQIIVEWQSALVAGGVHMQTGTGSGGDTSAGALYANLMDTGGGSHMIWSSPGVLVANQFQHIALTYDETSGLGTLYVNGTLVAQSSLGVFTPQTSNDFYLGMRLGGLLQYTGLMDEISVYDRALAANEIAAIYLAGSAGKCFIPTPPYITVQPASQTNVVGGTTTFSIAASGTPPLSYQWSFNGTNILNATNTTLMLADLQWINAGSYSVLVTNPYGATNSALATLAVNPAPPCDPPPSGLVSWWAAEGNALDSVSTNNGTLVGAVGYTSAEVGQGFVLDGFQEMVTVGNPPALQLQNFTIESWIQRVSTSEVHVGGGNGIIFGYGYGGYALYLDQDGTPVLTQIDIGNTQPPVSITDTNFHHLAVTKSGSTIFFYVDGVPYSAPDYNPTFVFSTVAAIGGRGDDLDNSFLGVIDETSVYNRPLTSNEIASIYLAGSAGKCFIPTPPYITVQPASQTNVVGGTTTFSVAASGTPPLSYQWSFNGTNILNTTNTTLMLVDLQWTNAGNYSVLVTNLYGATNSALATLAVNPAPPCDPAPSGLVAWWAAEGNVLDSIGTNSGVLQGGASYAVGEVGQAFLLDGASGDVFVPASSELNVGLGGGFTVEGWLNSPTTTAQQIIVEWQNTASLAFGVHMQTGTGSGGYSSPGALYANVVDTGGGYHMVWSGPGVLVANQFQHIALTYDQTSGVGTLYVNGSVVAQSSMGVFTPQTSNDFYLGTRLSGSLNYAGLLDEISVFDRALSTNEILAIYNAGSTGKCPEPPTIIQPPTNQAAAAGSTALFSVTASGSSPLNYQWRLNGTNLPAATNNVLTLTNLALSEAGIYDVEITNFEGSVTSLPAMLEVQLLLVEVNGQPDLGMANATSPATISLLGGYPGGYLFYTLDGTAPSTSSTLYTGPFALTNRATVNVLCTSADFSQSETNQPVTVVIIPTYGLQTSTVGNGTLSANPAVGPYSSNSVVTLTATPALHWAFGHWGGDASGNQNPLAITMNSPHAVQAVFVQDAFPLTLTTPGGGSVTANGATIPAGTYYATGNVVTLLATPVNGWVFLGWQGSISSTNNPLSLAISQTNTLQAMFGTVVGTNATGGEIVLSEPNPVPYGTILDISAVPNSGNYFVNWTGSGNGTADPYRLSVTSANPSFDAVFAPLPAGKYSLTTMVNGNGYITVTPQTGDYSPGATVYLYAYANSGAYFFGWTQGAAGTASPLMVVINSNKVIQASFGAGSSVTIAPTNETVLAGSNTVLNASAMGVAPLAYRWWNSFGPIIGATASAYTNYNTQPTNAGPYWVVVSNSFGSVTSSVANVTVIGAPVITNQPAPLTVTVGHAASFVVGATGWPAVAYQWRLNGGAMAGATNAGLTFSNAFPDGAGLYAVAVTNVYGCVTSVPARLTVLPLDISLPAGLFNGRFQFTFDTAAGLNYEVQYSTNLMDWHPWLDEYGSGQPFTLSDPDTGDSTRRFYRVVLTPP